jgi:uncharacterized protein with PQ loop repeat
MHPLARGVSIAPGHRHFIDYLADANSAISALALFPQLFTALREQTVGGLSPTSFFLIALNSGIWLAYGIHRRMPPLVISSSLNALASIGILAAMYLRS